jgi:transposase
MPKYALDLNPIEQLIAKLQHWLHEANKRSVSAVCDAVGQTVEDITNSRAQKLLPSMPEIIPSDFIMV